MNIYAYREARQIHAVLLRCEGLTFKEIGQRLENPGTDKVLSKGSACLLVQLGAKKISWAVRKARFRKIGGEYESLG